MSVGDLVDASGPSVGVEIGLPVVAALIRRDDPCEGCIRVMAPCPESTVRVRLADHAPGAVICQGFIVGLVVGARKRCGGTVVWRSRAEQVRNLVHTA